MAKSKESTALLVLKQSGSEITGTVGPNENKRFAIRKGTDRGRQDNVEVDHDGSTMTFNLVLAADRITGEAQMSRDGETRKAKIDVSRVK